MTTHTLLLRVINQYNTTIQCPDDPGNISEYHQFISSSRDAKNGTPILTIFGWLDRSRSFHQSNVRADIRGASLPLMHVIYTIGRHYLNAEVPYMMPDPVWEARAFMTFDPCKTKYKMSPSSVRSEGGEAAAGYCLNSVSYRVDEAVKYNVLNSD